jgi:hypothetical protein
MSFPGERVRLVVFPGEGKNRKGVTVGHIYVKPGNDVFEVAGGPVGGGASEMGGHTVDATPTGTYVLDHAEHHVTSNWPSSVVPWGAPIRERDEVVEYQVGGRWVAASGPKGSVTAAIILWRHRSGGHVTVPIAGRLARELFYDADGHLVGEWKANDFGRWSWNLKRKGVRTPYFIHTTPPDERATEMNQPFELSASHGCLHIRPRDRDRMIERGYLRAGTEVEVARYGVVGPPS